MTGAAKDRINQSSAALKIGDIEAVYTLDEDFHRFFCSAARLDGVWAMIDVAKARVDRVHRLAAVHGRLPKVIVEHRAILDALDEGDAERAKACLDFHLERAPTIVEALIEKHERYFVD